MEAKSATGALRVVHVVRQFSPSVGGLEDAVRNLVRYGRDVEGLDARVVTLDRVFTAPSERLPAQDVVDGIPVTRIPWTGSTRYPIAPGVLRHLDGADVVHVHAIDFFFDALAATRMIHGRPLVCSTHGGIFHTGAQLGLKKLFFQTVTRTSAKAYDVIVACSAADAAMFAPIAGRRLVTIENGVDVAKFAGRASAQPTRRIISFGRLASHKRITSLFAVLAALRRANSEWTLTVAGAAGDQPEAELAAAAQDAGVADAVRFVSNPDDTALAREIGMASYFASASAHEGFGIAAVEAMSSGLLPVLSDIPPFASLIQRTREGMLFDPAQPEQAAAQLNAIEATGGPTEARKKRVADVAASFAWPAASTAYARVYHRVSRRPVERAGLLATVGF